MTWLAGMCGVALVGLGLVLGGHAPTDARLGIEITCFVGGLVLCFIAVLLARLSRLAARLEALGILQPAETDGSDLDDPSPAL